MSFDWYHPGDRKYRPRRLFVNDKPMEAANRIALINNLQKGQAEIINTVNKAGQEALHCSGRGWYPESDIEVGLAQGAPFSINLAGFKRIKIAIDPKALLSRSLGLLGADSTQNPLAIIENATGATVCLFAGYYSHCPLDSWRHRELVGAAVRGAFGTYWVSEKEERLAATCALFFERSVVTYRLTEIEKDLFVQGLNQESLLNQRSPNLLSQLLDSMQSMIFPDCWKSMYPLAQVAPDPIVDALLPEVMGLVFDGRVRLVRGEMVLKGRTSIPPSWKWRSRVERLAEILVPYLQSDADSPGQVPNPFEPDGTGRRGEEGSGVAPGVGPDDFPLGPNPFDPSSRGEEDPSDSGRLPDNGPSGNGVSPGVPGRRPKIPYSLAIDEYYTKQASMIEIKGENDEGRKRPRPDNIVVGYLDYEEATFNDLLSSHIDWFQTRTCDKSEGNPLGLRLFKKTDPLEVPRGGDVDIEVALPNLLLVVDSSSSMGFNFRAAESNRGKYDLVLLATWGMLSYFAEASKGNSNKACAINFSSNTISSGWQPSTNLQEVKRILGTYQGGGTTLQTNVVRKALREQSESTLTVIITDGAVSNTPDAVKVFKEAQEQGHEVFLLHIGKETPFTKGIREIGGTVHLLNSAGDLVGLCIGLARKRYMPTGQQTTQRLG